MKKSTWVVGGVAAVVVLGVIGSVTGGGDSTGSTASTATSSSAPAKSGTGTTNQPATDQGPGVGDKARDGKFEFVVRSVAKDKDGRIENIKAQGAFWVVTLDVTNVGDDEGQYFGTNQKLTAGGKTFEYDDDQVYLGTGPWPLMKNINAGNSIKKVHILFDLPKNVKPEHVELHDSAFSDGVAVRTS